MLRKHVSNRRGLVSVLTLILKDEKLDNDLNWFWGDGAHPGGGSDTDVVWELSLATSALESANDCDMSDQVSANAAYAGPITRESEMDNGDGTVECEWDVNTDGYSVVDAGNIDDGGNPPVAVACVWDSYGTGYNTITEADIRFNTTDFDFTYTPATNCTYDWDLQSVATHEFGHAFGLKDLSEAVHPKLTMSKEIPPCNNAARTLGRGDILGLRAYY